MKANESAAHVGSHICIDGRRYNVSCLVTDPTCKDIVATIRGRDNLHAGEYTERRSWAV